MKSNPREGEQTQSLLKKQQFTKIQQSKRLKPQQQQLSIFVITWNLMGSLPSIQSLHQLLYTTKLQHDIVVIGTQECERSILASYFCEGKQGWESMLKSALQSDFNLVESQILQGLHLAVYIKKDKYRYVSNVRKNRIKTGYCGNMLANKGAVEIYMQLGSKKLLFVNVHLDASKISTKKRNQDLVRINDNMVEKQIADEVFLFGDLNYRISMSRQKIESYLQQRNFQILLQSDQLRLQTNIKQLLSKYKQKAIGFPPTYKLELQQNKYAKQRKPGWTDRILFKNNSNQLEMMQYDSNFNIFGSDHRPVFGVFNSKFNKIKENTKTIKKQNQKQFCILI